MMARGALIGALALAAGAAPRTAAAFCGFYVGGGDAKLYNNATLVVLMRDGTRTVLSMQNNYQGPPANFAMVVPVPVVLQKDDVKTLPREIFDRVDQLAAPRLVEYWEEDPCWQPKYDMEDARVERKRTGAREESAADGGGHGVTIEAQFTVGEYEVVILSAQDSGGLDAWLRENKYTIPDGAEPVLRPYVQQGMKFFVAKVDVSRVKFDAKGQAMLSPLRFHYDSEQFSLPVRLGLINSAGDQDLLVHVLADRRYEVANYPNEFIPTNLEVKDAVRGEFGEFYVALFDAVLRKRPKAVVTEYAWQANNCDPCPQTPLQAAELLTLGADALPKYQGQVAAKDGALEWRMPGEFVLTRLHARYSKEALGEDLVFREAGGVIGGREDGEAFKLPQGATPAPVNNFQARYIIRHPWEGKIACDNPVRGRWGGPPAGQGGSAPKAAQGLAFADRGKSLGMYVAQDVPELQVVARADAASEPATKSDTPTTPNATGKVDDKAAGATAKTGAGCGCTTGGADAGAGLFGLLALARVRRRRARS